MDPKLRHALLLAGLVACGELLVPRDVSGNFDVDYTDNLRIYLNDELVAEVVSGEDASFEYDGETFQVSQVCGDAGVECPGESYWRSVGIDQPWGDGNKLLNFVNLDPDRGEPGQRMGGILEDDGRFEMLSGLALDGSDGCASIGVGTVLGRFSPDNTELVDGVISYEWAGGCRIGGVDVGAKLRLETDYVASRISDLDLSSVEPAPPIDEGGEAVEPSSP